MPDARFNTWRDLLLDSDGFERLNKNVELVIDISKCESNNSGRSFLEAVRTDSQVVVLAVNQIEGDISFFHNVQELSRGIGSLCNSIAGLQGWGVEATAAQLEQRLFEHHSTVLCPTLESLWECTSASSFKNVQEGKGSNRNNITFGGLLTIPPFLSKAFIDAGSAAPEELGFLTVSAGKALLEEHKDTSNINSIKDKLGFLLCYLWVVSKNKISPTAHALSSRREFAQWSSSIHDQCIRPKGVPEPGSLGAIEGPSDLTMNALSDALVQVKTVLQDQNDSRTKAALEKKDKWNKVLSHHREMILNVGSPDGKVPAAAPTPATLELMKQETIIEAQAQCNALLKKENIRAMIPLIVVKALVSGNWCNKSEGPSKMSMFFIGPNSLLNDEESLFLALKFDEGTGFADEAIRSLLKKEFHIPTSPLELKEQLRCITVFHSVFNDAGKATREIKRVFDAVSKRDRLLRLLFNNDPLAGAKIIAALDNWWNLLLEECESASSPEECSSYFCTKDIIAQIESGSLNALYRKF